MYVHIHICMQYHLMTKEIMDLKKAMEVYERVAGMKEEYEIM